MLVVMAASGSFAQDSRVRTGWYNGDWQSGLPGLANWYSSSTEYTRVYDDFVVPAGGWTVVGVFSVDHMDFDGITKAAWEIRKDMSPGKSGKKVASGVSPATQIKIQGRLPSSGDPLIGYQIEVTGLKLHLAPGRYWLSVAPVGKNVTWFICATTGANAIGDPPGSNGSALVDHPGFRERYASALRQGSRGQMGRAADFSMGVLIEPAK